MKEAPGELGVLVREGSLVRVNQVVKGFPESATYPFAKVKRLLRTNAVLDVNGVERVAPLKVIGYCRRKGDRIDAKGRLLDLGMKVKITCYGGHISKDDIGSDGVIVKLNEDSAKVTYRRNKWEELTKNIPYSYLWRPDYNG